MCLPTCEVAWQWSAQRSDSSVRRSEVLEREAANQVGWSMVWAAAERPPYLFYRDGS